MPAEDPTPTQLNNMLDGIEWVRAFKPNPRMCCERCVFGTGKHGEFCTADTNLAHFVKQVAARIKKLHQDYDPLFRSR